jgi:hypothetical protein
MTIPNLSDAALLSHATPNCSSTFLGAAVSPGCHPCAERDDVDDTAARHMPRAVAVLCVRDVGARYRVRSTSSSILRINTLI